MTNHSCDFYVQLEPTWGWARAGEDKPVRAIRAVGITQKRPTKPKAGTVIAKLTLQIPDGAFMPLRPEATIIIPESLTQAFPIVVEATDPAEV